MAPTIFPHGKYLKWEILQKNVSLKVLKFIKTEFSVSVEANNIPIRMFTLWPFGLVAVQPSVIQEHAVHTFGLVVVFSLSGSIREIQETCGV